MKRLSWMILAIAVVSAACGDGGTLETPAGDGAAADTTAASTTSEASDTTTSDSEDGEETLADFLPFFGFSDDPEAAQAQIRQQEQQVQETVRECMAAEGFDYIPFVPDEGAMYFGPGSDLSEEEFAEQYGFGFTTFLIDDPFMEEDVEFHDPNEEIVEAMDEATRDEYYRLLYGDEPDIDFESMTEEEIDEFYQDFQPTGCYSEAQHSVFAFDGFYQEFGDELDAMYEKVQSDPRIVALEAEWSACMAEQGYEFAAMDDIYTYLERRQNEVVTWNEPSQEDIAAMEEEFGEDGPTEEQIAEMDALFGPQYDEAELKALNDEEIAIAVANLSCNEGREDLFQEVFEEYEKEFVAANRDALEKFRSEG